MWRGEARRDEARRGEARQGKQKDDGRMRWAVDYGSNSLGRVVAGGWLVRACKRPDGRYEGEFTALLPRSLHFPPRSTALGSEVRERATITPSL